MSPLPLSLVHRRAYASGRTDKPPTHASRTRSSVRSAGIRSSGWFLDLVHHFKPVRLTPMLDNPATRNTQDVDPTELHPAVGRRDTHLTALMSTDPAPADNSQITIVQHRLNLGFQVGKNREIHGRQPVQTLNTGSLTGQRMVFDVVGSIGTFSKPAWRRRVPQLDEVFRDEAWVPRGRDLCHDRPMLLRSG